MFKCEDCKMVIDDFKNLAEEFDGSKVCPYCRADVEEVEECDCGNWMSKGEMFCEKCKIDLRKQFSRLLHENFDEKEIQMLNELFDGEELN